MLILFKNNECPVFHNSLRRNVSFASILKVMSNVKMMMIKSLSFFKCRAVQRHNPLPDTLLFFDPRLIFCIKLHDITIHSFSIHFYIPYIPSSPKLFLIKVTFSLILLSIIITIKRLHSPTLVFASKQAKKAFPQTGFEDCHELPGAPVAHTSLGSRERKERRQRNYRPINIERNEIIFCRSGGRRDS